MLEFLKVLGMVLWDAEPSGGGMADDEGDFDDGGGELDDGGMADDGGGAAEGDDGGSEAPPAPPAYGVDDDIRSILHPQQGGGQAPPQGYPPQGYPSPGGWDPRMVPPGSPPPGYPSPGGWDPRMVPPGSPPPGYPPSPGGGMPREIPPLPDPDLARTDPGEYTRRMNAHLEARDAALTERLTGQLMQSVGQDFRRLESAMDNRTVQDVTRSIQEVDHAVENAMAEGGLFWSNPLYAGSEKVRAATKEVLTEQLQKAVAMADATGDTRMLRRFLSPRHFSRILHLGIADSGVSIHEPQMLKVVGAAMAQSTGGGRSAKPTKAELAELEEAHEAGYTDLTIEDIRRNNTKLDKLQMS